MPRLILGSASPRRAELLRALGVDFEVRASDVPETPRVGEAAQDLAQRLARDKGVAVAGSGDGTAWVLSADTVVVLDGIALGKPADAAEARAMLRALSGRAHAVITAVALSRPDGSTAAEIAVQSTVEMRPLGDAEIEAYLATGEPYDKAGGYGIQGGASRFVTRVSGSYTNVVGLPVDEVRTLLARFGLLPAARGAAGPARHA